MIEPIDHTPKVTPKNLPGSGALKTIASNPAGSILQSGDHVSFNADSLLESVRAELGALKNDLPSLIQQALLEPPTSSAIRQEPINALIFRLQDPLKTILGAVNEVPEELLTQIQGELESFKLVFPELKNHELVAPFLNDPEKAGPLSGLLNALTLQVDDLSGILRTL